MSELKSPPRKQVPVSLDVFKEFIAAQLAKQADPDEEDRVIVHADCGFGEGS